ncbi:MAG: hypothetical protein ACKODX_14275 [Gemmata sp.]
MECHADRPGLDGLLDERPDFHWHWNGNKYLQLEQKQLCFKIMVEDKAQQSVAWHEWHRTLVTAARQSGLPVKRPDRRGVGTWMTVAVWDGEYRQASEPSGLLDLERTVDVLKRAESLLDAAAKTGGPDDAAVGGERV